MFQKRLIDQPLMLQVLADMAYRGALTLDVFPEEMTAKLVNEYLEVKARHLL